MIYLPNRSLVNDCTNWFSTTIRFFPTYIQSTFFSEFFLVKPSFDFFSIQVWRWWLISLKINTKWGIFYNEKTRKVDLFAVFFQELNEWINIQINFSCQNFSIEYSSYKIDIAWGPYFKSTIFLKEKLLRMVAILPLHLWLWRWFLCHNFQCHLCCWLSILLGSSCSIGSSCYCILLWELPYWTLLWIPQWWAKKRKNSAIKTMYT